MAMLRLMATRLRQRLSNGARFWERLRIYFNFWLACILLFHFLLNWPHESMFVRTGENPLAAVFALGLIANATYSAAYLIDIFIQMFAARENWRLFRLIFYCYGMLAAGLIMNVIAGTMFARIFS